MFMVFAQSYLSARQISCKISRRYFKGTQELGVEKECLPDGHDLLL